MMKRSNLSFGELDGANAVEYKNLGQLSAVKELELTNVKPSQVPQNNSEVTEFMKVQPVFHDD